MAKARRPNRGIWMGKKIQEWRKKHKTNADPPLDTLDIWGHEWHRYEADWYRQHPECQRRR